MAKDSDSANGKEPAANKNWIESWYNPRWLHSSLGYPSPTNSTEKFNKPPHSLKRGNTVHRPK